MVHVGDGACGRLGGSPRGRGGSAASLWIKRKPQCSVGWEVRGRGSERVRARLLEALMGVEMGVGPGRAGWAPARAAVSERPWGGWRC